MGLAIIFRILAAIFAKGWGMLDDHFLIIEAPQSWVYGYDYNYWLPWSKGNTGPSGHNFFYPGVHFLLFTLMKWIHLNDPQDKMLVVRILHGAFSLITVYYGYRIVDSLDNRRSARLAGILLAIYFFIPWASVRNLAEWTSVPFLMLGFWYMIRSDQPSTPFRTFFLAGIMLGLAADIRYQLVIFPAGVAMVMIFRRKWLETLGIAVGVTVSFLFIQALIDLFIWGYPFAEFLGYINVNITDRNSYFTLPWYNYFLTVGGIMLPPLSLLLLYGFIRGWRRYSLLFFPAALFFAFHSYFPNKQERFILPFIPFLIMLGTIGYYQYIAPSDLWQRRKKILKGTWIFFWVINCLLLIGLTFMYSKRARVESMYYLSRYPYLKNIIVEDEKGEVPMLPIFYTGKWPVYPEKPEHDSTIFIRIASIAKGPKFHHPQFFIFCGEKNLDHRVAKAQVYFPLLVYETTIDPGFIDQLMHFLNPVNKADKIYIYRNRGFYPEKIK